jgi:hypothetical protein
MQGGGDPANVDRHPVWLDRVTAPHLMLIWPEEEGWAQYIGALVTLDGRSLFDADRRLLIAPVREAIGRRLHLAPRFRQVLYWPKPGPGWPVWGMPNRSTSPRTSPRTACRLREMRNSSSSPARPSAGARCTEPGRCGRCGS